jgi:hypothetical protein
MDAVTKTKNLRREDIPVGLLVPDVDNPNKMTSRQFDLLVDNFTKTGFTDPVLVRAQGDGTYKVIGGHHRLEAAKYLGFTEAPCTIIDDPEFDEEAAIFQNVRMNVIRGQMDPESFFKMYEKMSGKYETDVLQELFGFADAKDFAKLVAKSAKLLPSDLQEKFKEAAKEIKTIDGLAQLLNEMFTKYGDSLPFSFMVFDYGGQKSVWLQVSAKTMDAFDKIGFLCRENRRSVDDVVGGILQSIAGGKHEDLLALAVEKAPEVKIPAGFGGLGTKQELAAAEMLGDS